MRLLAFIALITCGLAVAGCESSFDQAARARAEAGTVEAVVAVDMQQVTGVTAETLAIIPSADGLTAAVVIKVTATPAIALIWAPIEVRLLDAAGTEVGTNNIPGALPILIHLAALHGGQSAFYVNDQIMLSGVPVSAEVVIGGEPVSGAVPDNLATSKPVIAEDPGIGASWTVKVTNTTPVRQEQVIVQAIMRDGDTIIGAGTANVDGLDPGASVDVIGYLVGASTGTLEVFAPPSNVVSGFGAPAIGATTGSVVTGTLESGSTPVMTLQIDS